MERAVSATVHEGPAAPPAADMTAVSGARGADGEVVRSGAEADTPMCGYGLFGGQRGQSTFNES